MSECCIERLKRLQVWKLRHAKTLQIHTRYIHVTSEFHELKSDIKNLHEYHMMALHTALALLLLQRSRCHSYRELGMKHVIIKAYDNEKNLFAFADLLST
jgi:hypothetical protein